MATIDVKDAANLTVAIEKPLTPGRAAAASSRPIVLSTEDKTALDALATQVTAAAILAKIIAAPSTEAKQDAVIAALAGNLATVPRMTSGGNTSAQTAATGTNYTLFASQACKQLTIVNNTGTALEFRQDAAGVAVPVFDQSSFTIFGITNANQIGIRRVDTSNTQVTAQARWEA